MKKGFKIGGAALMGVAAFTLSSFFTRPMAVKQFKFPYKSSGLTEREAAEHLLDRFTYGATPGQVDSVVKMGLENWFEKQLDGNLADDSLSKRLAAYPDINLSNTEVCKIYPPGFVIRSLAIKDSAISKDSVDKAIDKKAFNAQVQGYMAKKGFKNDQDLYKQFIDQRIVRAIYSNNQLEQVMTDFWFNHFNVSFFKGECAQFIPAYEREVIRPNALGKFDVMLMASAKSPAMLYYLDNFTSVGPPPPPAPKAAPKPVAPKTDDANMMMTGGNNPQQTAKTNTGGDMMMSSTPPATKPANAGGDMMMMAASTAPAKKPANSITQPGKNVNGLNENYAREVMELHTLGVDGGYTQSDVTQAARVLTGWTVYAISDNAYGAAMKGLVARVGEQNLANKGYTRDGDFLFTPERHDRGEKVVLGHVFPASKDPITNYQEGVDLLEMLAHHPSTAKFISRKLAARFVSDVPPQSLVNKMAKSFTDHDGDIRQVLITMVTSKEFWDKKALDVKTKSPYELAISSVRGLKADVKDPYQLFNWMTRMGQKIFYYQAPTGFPDRGTYWINTGSLLSRMDFSLALTTGQIGGVKVNLTDFLKNQPANTAEDLVKAYSRSLMQTTDPELTVKNLAPVLNDPAMLAKLSTPPPPPKPAAPAPEKPTVGAPGDMALMSAVTDLKPVTANPTPAPAQTPPPTQTLAAANFKVNNNYVRSLIAGVIIGSPQFQRK